MTKSEYFTGSNITNYCVTTAYLQDTSEMALRDLADRIQEEFRRRKVDYTKEINTDRPTEKGMELVPLGRLETKDEYLLNILKENGFYLMYQKRDSKFGEFEYYQVLYPIC